jgi:cytochrome c
LARYFGPGLGIGGATLAIALLVGSGTLTDAMADHVASSESIGPKHGARLVIPLMNPDRGKELFVSKGCVACHAINGVGGHDAPPMDAHRDMGLVNPFDFAAMMWNHAPAMVAAQEEAFGEQIYFTGQELADIIAFMHDDTAQHSFTEHDLTPQARKMMHHEHGGQPAPAAHAEEVGHKAHKHAPGTPVHND